MEIIKIESGKRKYMDLLFLADEQESMIEEYLDRGDMFLLKDNENAAGECIVVRLEKGIYEIKNIAVSPEFQKRGYGKELIKYVEVYYEDLKTLYVGTGESPLTIPFYKKCGFTESHRIKNFFVDNYDHPIIECGKQLKDMVYLKKEFEFNRKEVTKMDMEYVLQQLKNILAIDSPSGYTKEVTDYLLQEFTNLGIKAYRTIKGGVIAEIDGKDENNAIFLESHVDTLGAMVSQIKSNGCLEISPVGGIGANTAECETVRIRTRDGKVYDGTCQLCNASVHVNGKYADTMRTYDVMEIVIDEKVFSKEETEKLGIAVGDYVCFEPRTMITKSGYIKSRFLDDKLSSAILLGYAKHLKDEKIVPERKIYIHMTVYEEVGHGGSASVPEGVTEVMSVDMGCVGDGLTCKEHQVSICAKDSGGPYNYEVVSALVEAAKKAGVDYAIDVYPHYGSDAEATLRAGYDVKHSLIGAGVYASHGYERSHVDGVKNTLLLLKEYLG